MDRPAIDRGARVSVPSMFLPQFRLKFAIEDGVQNHLLFHSWGGLGDQICTEPTVRYAVENFKGCEISIVTDRPEIYKHIPLARVYNTDKDEIPAWDYFLYLPLMLMLDDSNLVWQFLPHLTTHCIDYPALLSIRMVLPVDARQIKLCPDEPKDPYVRDMRPKVLVHAGKSWPSKTFPPDWWNAVLGELVERGVTPVLIGAKSVVKTDLTPLRTTVELKTDGCIDLRDKLSLMDSTWLMQHSKALITNDSSPLHAAASGDAWIHYISTAKHPDLVKHWRHGEFGWHMKNHAKGGCWSTQNYGPHAINGVSVLEAKSEEELRSWLPNPKELVEEVLRSIE